MPTPEQIEAAIEGAADMPEVSKTTGRVVVPGESPLRNPAEETGGPRGAGYPASHTTGGTIEADEAIKRETAVFQPGSHGKKPAPNRSE